MIEHVDRLVGQYRKAGIIIDTNLLLLLFIGTFQPALIADFKRTQQFTEDDYVLPANFSRRFDRIVTTPNILTEVNSLANQLPEHRKAGF